MPRNRKRGRQSKKSKKKRLNQQIINLHSTLVGFYHEQDWKECVDIHLILLQCPLIKNILNEFDQNILKEIATYSTGKCLDCIRCRSPCSILHGNTVDHDSLYNICRENDYTNTSKDKLLKKANEIFNGEVNKIGYIEFKEDKEFYVCSACFTNELIKARFCKMCETPIYNATSISTGDPEFHEECYESYEFQLSQLKISCWGVYYDTDVSYDEYVSSND